MAPHVRPPSVLADLPGLHGVKIMNGDKRANIRTELPEEAHLPSELRARRLPRGYSRAECHYEKCGWDTSLLWIEVLKNKHFQRSAVEVESKLATLSPRTRTSTRAGAVNLCGIPPLYGSLNFRAVLTATPKNRT